MGWGMVGKAKEPDPLIDIITKMMDQQERERQVNTEVIKQLMQSQNEQNKILRDLMGQYVAQGQNQTSGLDERLYEKEQDFDWDPLDEDPFKKLGIE